MRAAEEGAGEEMRGRWSNRKPGEEEEEERDEGRGSTFALNVWS